MKVSLNWIQEYLAFPLPSLEELQAKIGAQLGAIEAVEAIGDKYKGVIIARVVSLKDHPGADRLHVVMIDDGGVAKNVNRDEQGRVQVVCGAQNLYEGMLVPWLPPGAVVPETYDKEQFVLEAREMRGVMSNGMLTSARELGLGTDHTGIVDLKGADAQPGTSFVAAYKLDDRILDIENKMFTHRPDCFGQLGVAREIAGILNRPFVSPEWYSAPSDSLTQSGDSLPLHVTNELPEQVPRFMTAVFHVDHVGPSPVWLQTYLVRVGLRPINNLVDITNYVMMATAQPLHAYDYDKVKTHSNGEAALVIRYPRPDEKITLLNGKTVEPRSEAIMIATDKELIGVGGVMGGADTEVDENTKTVILECGTFDMYSIRRTSMAHGLFTDAVARFNKGQSPLQNDRVMGLALSLFSEIAGAKLAGAIQDDNHVQGRAWMHPPVPITVAFINDRLGLHLTADEMKRLLENVEFKVDVQGESLTVTAPFWRTDIELREDVVEEIGRLYGYDKLPLDLPMRSVTPVDKDEQLELKRRVREKLASRGANEALTYSFIHGTLLDNAGQDKTQAFQISNAISPDLQYYRLSLTPSLLDRIHTNVKAGYDQFALFEMGLIHHKGAKDENDANVPLEDAHVSLVMTAGDKTALSSFAGAAYYEALEYLKQVLPDVTSSLVPLKDFDFKDDAWGKQMCAPYEPNRAAVVLWNDLAWGVVGEYKQSVTKALKLPAFTAGFEIGLELVRQVAPRGYEPLPRYPKVEQDICLKVPSDMTYKTAIEFMQQKIDALKPEQSKVRLSPVDIYQRTDDTAHKQITVRLSIASYERTLTDDEVAKILDQVAVSAQEALHAERV